MLHRVKNVKYIEKYKLQLSFYNGDVRLVDFEKRLESAKNIFVPLKDVEYFKKVSCDDTTIVWPNGLDLCPDVLYEMGVEVKAEKKKPIKKETAKKSSSSSVIPKPPIAAKPKRQ